MLHSIEYKDDIEEVVNVIYQRIAQIRSMKAQSPLLASTAVIHLAIYIALQERNHPFDFDKFTDALDYSSLKKFYFLFSQFFDGLRDILRDDKRVDLDLESLLEKVTVKEYKINKFLSLKLQFDKTYIYVKNKYFRSCMYLLLNVPTDTTLTDEIRSIDEAEERLDKTQEYADTKKVEISPETEFWGHCSNIQAWVENNYDSRILHRNLAFPLLSNVNLYRDVLPHNHPLIPLKHRLIL